MNSRVLLLMSALVAGPAWSQDAPSFDFGSDAVRLAVKKTAATQYAVPPGEQPVIESRPVATVRWVPPEEKPMTEKAPKPAPAPVAVARKHEGPLSALVTTLVNSGIDSLVGVDEDLPVDDWLRCPARAAAMHVPDVIDACPGRPSTWSLTEPLGYQAPEIRAP